MLTKFKQHPLYLYRDFRNFFIGDVLVAIAERYFAITFAWWIISQDGENGKWLALLMTIEAIPILVLSPFIGPLVDRYNKKWCMLVGVLAQLFFVTIIWLLMRGDSLQYAYLLALSFLMSCFIPQFEDSVSASVSSLVRKEHLSAATAIQSSSIEFSNIFAAVISTSIIAALGIEHAVFVNMALYAIGAIFLLTIKSKQLAPGAESESDEETEEAEESSYWSEFKVGLHYIRTNRPLYLYAIIYAFETFFIVPIFILIPMLVNLVLHQTVNWVAVFEATLSIGAILTAVFLSFRQQYRHFYRIYASAMALIGALMITLGCLQNGYWMAVVIFFIGGLFALLMALSFMLFQHVVPRELKGRFFGVMSTIAAGMSPLSYMTVGLLSDALSIEAVLWINGCGALLLALAAIKIPRLREHITAVSEDEE